jgi:hypothetical protein
MTKQAIIRAMASAGIVGIVSGHGEAWEVTVPSDEVRDAFRTKVAAVGARASAFGGWTLRPMSQAGLAFGTLDSGEQREIFQ